MKLSQYGYDYDPATMLARYPADNRDESRLMVVNRADGSIEHRTFRDILDYFDEKDLFVFNNTKVFPARLYGNKEKTGAEIEAPEGEKSRFASLKKGQLIESITLEEALELFALPRTLGELDGEELAVGIGKYGAYVRYGKSFASLAKTDDHGMVIVGTARDQAGTPYYKVLNSWDDLPPYGGHWYFSRPFVAYKTTDIMVNKNALPKEIAKKLGLK